MRVEAEGYCRVALSESQTANYKNPKATSPSLSSSTLLVSYLARPARLGLHHSQTCSVFIPVSHLSIRMRTPASLVNPGGGNTGEGKGEEEREEKTKSGDESGGER